MFEEEALKKSPWKPKLWLRYVDDTFVIWQHGKEQLHEFLDHLNSQHPMIKFTMETETAKQLPFLDVLVTRKTDGGMELGVYRKRTHTNRYLQTSSDLHLQQKRSVIQALFQRAERICDKENLRKEKRFLEDVLQKNGYTMRDIRQKDPTICSRRELPRRRTQHRVRQNQSASKKRTLLPKIDDRGDRDSSTWE
nr:uncharacterized protein LOC111429032 [Onthophagus taurus]